MAVSTLTDAPQTTMQRLAVSLIATVKNEADNIADLLDSMLAQTRAPDEIVINDNHSTDETPAIVERYIAAGHPIRLVRGGFNIPSGRNNAIRHARGPLIASCDAGLVLPPHWLETIVAPLERGEADLVGGFYEPAPRSTWELALGATNFPDAREIDPAAFLPGGNSMAFTKSAWGSVGGYPEWADTCEDLVFDLELKRRGYRMVFAPEAAVQFRPRESARAYFWQYFTYARGDGVADLWLRRHLIRYASYIGLLGVVLLARRWRSSLLLLLPGIVYHTYRPYRRLWSRSRDLPLRQRLAACAWVPAVRLIGDLGKMAGYPIGLWRRRARRQAQGR
ncbi:MAG TPA: glycosyltransferase [Herpetosiphonaceae bacterium]